MSFTKIVDLMIEKKASDVFIRGKRVIEGGEILSFILTLANRQP